MAWPQGRPAASQSPMIAPLSRRGGWGCSWVEGIDRYAQKFSHWLGVIPKPRQSPTGF